MGKQRQMAYTPEQDAYILEWYGKKDVSEIARDVTEILIRAVRTEFGIKCRAQKLGVAGTANIVSANMRRRVQPVETKRVKLKRTREQQLRENARARELRAKNPKNLPVKKLESYSTEQRIVKPAPHITIHRCA